MTVVTVEEPEAWTEALARLPVDDVIELACKAHLGVWAEEKRGLLNAPLHWEWSEIAMTATRGCVVAPREHAKTEVFTVNQMAWRCQYTPGFQGYVFAQTGDQAAKLKERIDTAIADTAPWMLNGPHTMTNKTESRYANWSQISVAGAGKGVRGVHPDGIVGDDVLEEGNTLTAHQRKAVHRWWAGTIGGMAHPGTTRPIGRGKDARRVRMPPTRVHLVGTPFHAQDLLMSMKENPLYQFRRYAAEFREGDLVPGTMAVEVA